MTREELKKHIRPLVWENDCDDNSLAPINCIDRNAFICQTGNGMWYSYGDDDTYHTKEEAIQAIEEYHIRELSKFFVLDKD